MSARRLCSGKSMGRECRWVQLTLAGLCLEGNLGVNYHRYSGMDSPCFRTPLRIVVARDAASLADSSTRGTCTGFVDVGLNVSYEAYMRVAHRHMHGTETIFTFIVASWTGSQPPMHSSPCTNASDRLCANFSRILGFDFEPCVKRPPTSERIN